MVDLVRHAIDDPRLAWTMRNCASGERRTVLEAEVLDDTIGVDGADWITGPR